jgi:hypothetical protein
MDTEEFDVWYWMGFDAYWAGLHHVFDATEQQQDAWLKGWKVAQAQDIAEKGQI